MPAAKPDFDASLVIPFETFRAAMAFPFAKQSSFNLANSQLSQKLGWQEKLKPYLNTDMVSNYYKQITQKYGEN